jgi:probable O-glycosylation ligase (exosortase A-associated)
MRTRLKLPPTADGIDERRTEYLYWWLLVAIFFEYVRPGQWVPGIDAIKLNSLIPLTLLALTVFAKGLRPFQQIFADRSARWLTFFLFLVLLSIPTADVTLYSFNIFKGILGYYFVFLMIARIATSARRIRGVFGVLIVAHLFMIAMTPQIVLSTGERPYMRGGPFLGDGNDFSLSLCILIAMTIAIAQGTKVRVTRLIAWGSLGIMLLAIVGSQSRGATLGAIAVAGFLWLLSKRKLVGLAIMGVAAVAIALYASDAYFDRISTIRDYQSEGSAQGRIIAWKASLRMAADSPLLGVGAGHFPVAFGARYMPRDLGPMPWLTAHSTYFLVLGELGLPGIVTILALVLGNIHATLALRRRLLAGSADHRGKPTEELAGLLNLVTASMLGFAVAGAFLSAAYYPHLFVLTGIMIAARDLARASISATGESRATRRRSSPTPRTARAAGRGIPAA